MFKQNADMSKQGGGVAETTIGPSVKVEGDVNAVGDVFVEGTVQGTISTDQHVTIGANAEVIADIKANSAEIAGKVKGKITIVQDLAIKSTAHITGDLSTSNLSMEKGATLNGQVTMGSAPVISSSSEEKES